MVSLLSVLKMWYMKYNKFEVPVSIVMPVYNSIEYLEGTVNSILTQTFPDFELIMVDDGSTDGSRELCDALSEMDSRVKVIHKVNGGISSARNLGLKVARGEYIAFCDDDDKYLPDLLKDNYSLAKQYDADVVRFKRLKISKKFNGRIVKTKDDLKQFAVLQGKEEIGKNYAAIRSSYLAVWSGLFRHNFIRKHNISFPRFMRYGQEDGYFMFSCYRFAESIVLNPKIYYYWIQRERHSTTGKFNKNLVESIIYNMGLEWKTISEIGTYDFSKKCYFICAKTCMRQVFAYIDQNSSPYNFIQKAGIMREICRRIPDMSLLYVTGDDEILLKNIKQKNGFAIYRYLKKEGIEW